MLYFINRYLKYLKMYFLIYNYYLVNYIIFWNILGENVLKKICCILKYR